MVTLRTDELEEMQVAIDAGKLPADAIKRHFAEEEQRVFGNAPRGRDGKPIEQGIGSAANPSENSVRDYETFCKDEPDFKMNLAKMKADLAAHQAKHRPAPR